VRRDQDRYSGARWPRRGRRVVFHTDRGSTYTARSFTGLCERLGVRQSMGRVGSCFDNAAAEAFFSTLEHEVLSRHHFTTRAQARAVVVAWCLDFYNTRWRHSSGIAGISDRPMCGCWPRVIRDGYAELDLSSVNWQTSV
jgi:transposase InsO family protein